MVSLSALKDHLVTAGASAMLLGGSATLITTKIDIARHDERITRIEKLDETMTSLSKEMAATREALARVEARQEKQSP